MTESSDEPSPLSRICFATGIAHDSRHNPGAGDHLPLSLNEKSAHHPSDEAAIPNYAKSPPSVENVIKEDEATFHPGTNSHVVDKESSALPPLAPPPQEGVQEEASSTVDSGARGSILIRFYLACKGILLASWMNVLLAFVPAGIAVKVAGINPNVVFAINAIAIIPLAGLLTHATESVASEMGDTIGALMNITFGNAVELIIFIALVKNEIRIVQASLLGSILANLLLILGMCFLLGGLRFREQILLLVYVLYILFQLKSHAYMYQSTPQHVIDEESHPGLLAEIMNSSGASSSSSSSSDTDSDNSSGSHTTAKRIKRVLRGRKRRKSNASSKETPSVPSTLRTPSVGTSNHANYKSEFSGGELQQDGSFNSPNSFVAIASGDEADTDGENGGGRRKTNNSAVNFRDFEKENTASGSRTAENSQRKTTRRKRKALQETVSMGKKEATIKDSILADQPSNPPLEARVSAPRVGFVKEVGRGLDLSPKRSFGKRGITNVLPAMPAVDRMFSSTVFSAMNPSGIPDSSSPAPFAPFATRNPLHRSSSLPSRLNRVGEVSMAAPEFPRAYPRPAAISHPSLDPKIHTKTKSRLSRTSAIILLLVSTGLVALCADFLVNSINHLVKTTDVSEAFIGLIILPIVGNAAEHVTAVVVASKNKMDLAIGVAVGSSIQIALFVTPVIVLLGWILHKDMSLYFSLFETISLFVSAFIVNFLVLDGRSNYLEGALLNAAYVIIAPPLKSNSSTASRHSPRLVENALSPSWASAHSIEDHSPTQFPFGPRNTVRTPPFLAKSKKRALSRLPANLPSPSGQPPFKKPRRRVKTQRALGNPINPRSVRDNSPLPPSLFPSNRRQRRPTLPIRLSSSEAGSTMLNRSHKDDSGAIRTLKLARGSAKSDSSKHVLRHGAQDLARKSTEGDEVRISKGLAILNQVGVTELLDQDDRPTFVIDLGDQANFELGPLSIIYANVALRAAGGLLEFIAGKEDKDSPGLAAIGAFSDFKAWSTSYVRNHEALDVGLPSFFFFGMTWTCCTLKKRLRLIRGTSSPTSASVSSNPPSVGIPSSRVLGKDGHGYPGSSYDSDRMIKGEPLDYFGNFRSSLPALGPEAAVEDDKLMQRVSQTSARDSPRNTLMHSSTWPDSDTVNDRKSDSGSASQSTELAFSSRPNSYPKEATWGPLPVAQANNFEISMQPDSGFFDWTRLPMVPTLPKHIQFARSIDWASTKLGPIESWSTELRCMCNMIMASPHPAAMYWGDDLIAIYNEAYILLAGEKHPTLMGQSYRIAWAEIWDNVKDVFANAFATGQATMKDDDCLFIRRSSLPGFLEETFFSWSIIPLVGLDGSVVGLYNPAFEKTRRKIAERRMLTLREVGEQTAAARELKAFWSKVLKALEYNECDSPFVILYSVGDDIESEASSMQSSSVGSVRQCNLEGTLGVPEGHPAAPSKIDLKAGPEYFAHVFREAMKSDRPILLQVENETLDANLLQGLHWRGYGDPCRAAVCCPIFLTGGDSILGFLVMGLNPRRPYDDDYSLFVQLLSRQLTTSSASVVLYEEEIARGRRAAQVAALDRTELSEQLAIRTQEAVESETKFTRMAEFAPVGIFIADSQGQITYCNDAWYEISRVPKAYGSTEDWMDFVKDEDKERVFRLWDNLVQNAVAMNCEFRFNTPWEDQQGHRSDTWVLASAYPEKNETGGLKIIFGSLTNISQQKWAELLEKRKMEEAVEMKRQQENFIDITSHEMRNPLSAILQCADEIASTLKAYRSSDHALPQLLDDLLDSNIDAAQTIALCAQHQKRIVDDILTLSKLDSALLLVTPCDVMPASVVQRALKMFDGEVQTAHIKLNFQIDDSLQKHNIQWVKLDPSRLLQVLINLITNAIKFTTTQAKRVITVVLGASIRRPSKTPGFNTVSYFPTRTKRSDLMSSADWGTGEKCHLYFAVQDTGRGLTEDETKLLFHRFSQASPRTHVQYGGSGLGLFISRELVELQGGEIGVASRAGEGSTFAFYIAARRSTTPQEALDQSPYVGMRSERVPSPNVWKASKVALSTSPAKALMPKTIFKILIVEDNLVNQRVLQRQLRNLGCIVYVANHGVECIDRLKESTFWKNHSKEALDLSVVLMDLEMPVMDGLTCARKIRDLQDAKEIIRHVPLIAVTANARSEQIDTALAAGMVSFLPLPIHFSLFGPEDVQLILGGSLIFQDDVVSKPFRILDLIPKIEELDAKYGGGSTTAGASASSSTSSFPP
ncbi:MAG: hypothetical protein Q9167_007828 [Letrouitia subvulpina]